MKDISVHISLVLKFCSSVFIKSFFFFSLHNSWRDFSHFLSIKFDTKVDVSAITYGENI